MSTISSNNLSIGYLQSILGSSLQNVGSTSKNSNSLSGIDAPSSSPQEGARLSPLAQVLSTLQQLQQSNPTEYQQVTQQIATNLQSAAQTAQSENNTTAATQLNQLSTDFSNASKSNQLPDVQDLAKAVAGHHHHHHHGNAASSQSSSSNQSLSQLFQANGAQSDALNPMNIILSSLPPATASS